MNEAGSNRRLVLAAMCALHLSVSGCIGDLIPDRPDLRAMTSVFRIPSPSTFPRNFRAMPPVTARLVPATAMNVSAGPTGAGAHVEPVRPERYVPWITPYAL